MTKKKKKKKKKKKVLNNNDESCDVTSDRKIEARHQLFIRIKLINILLGLQSWLLLQVTMVTAILR